MYTSLSIRNFRAFQSLDIEGLKRVNLFAGRNNSGKTSVLEALYLLEAEQPAARARQLFRNRGLADAGIVHQTALDMPWATLFRNLAVELDISIAADSASSRRKVSLSTNLDNSDRVLLKKDFGLPASERLRNVLVGHCDGVAHKAQNWIAVLPGSDKPVGEEDAELNVGSFLLSNGKLNQRELVIQFGRFEVENQDVFIMEALRLVEPRLRGLSTILLGGSPVLHADVEGGERRLPLAVVGDGMLRMLEIVFAILQNRDKIVLIDEVENGFHHSALPKVWKLIHSLAKQYNVQVFAVTHSQECANAAHYAAVESQDYDYQYYRLEQDNGVGYAHAFSQRQLQTAIDVDLEVR